MNEQLSAQRLAAYRERWGDPVGGYEWEIAGRTVRVHVFADELADGSPIQVLYTDGLSDAPVAPRIPLTELVFYVPDAATDAHLAWVQFACIIHLVDQIDLFWRTIPFATAPSDVAPLAPGSLLTSVTFQLSPLKVDNPDVVTDAGNVSILWMVPVTEAERAWLRGHEGDDFGKALATMLQEARHPWVLQPLRGSYR